MILLTISQKLWLDLTFFQIDINLSKSNIGLNLMLGLMKLKAN